MGKLVFSDGTYIEYANGRFDQWCVFLHENGSKYPPMDIDYFHTLKQLGETYDAKRIYDEFVKIYQRTSQNFDSLIIEEIRSLSSGYGQDSVKLEKVLGILYMAMVSEENKMYTKLGKRIKRLGVHKLLIDNSPVSEAANFMKNVPWRTIDRWCKEKGF